VGSEETYFVHNSQLGTPELMTDDGRAVVWEIQTTPFGEVVDEDPDPEAPNAVIQSIRFPGQYYDAETGLHYNWHRYYDPSIGRYISADPIGQAGGVLNLYSYALNDPINVADPLGLFNIFTSFGDYAAEAYTAYKQLQRNKDELLDANTQDADKYFHCKAHCEACSEGPGGNLMSTVASYGRETSDLADGVSDSDINSPGTLGDALSDSASDVAANDQGRAAGERGDQCAGACSSLAPPGLPYRYSSEIPSP
jgi:RHS repeat-associated protein